MCVGGFTYCAISALSLLRRLPTRISDDGPKPSPGQSGLTNFDLTIDWLVSRQTEILDEDQAKEMNDADTGIESIGGTGISVGPFTDSRLQWAGFNGRSNKIADTCYCFWACGALSVRT